MEYVRRSTSRRRKGRRRIGRCGSGVSYTGNTAVFSRAKKPEGIGIPNLLLLLILSAALIYLLTATPVGPYLLNKAQACVPYRGQAGSGQPPTSSSPSSSPENGIAASPELPVKESFTFPALKLFALQIGAYDNVENAGELIASLRSLGAAGYCLAESGDVRILASCYDTREAAETVCERLNAQGHSCVVYELSSEPLTLEVTAPQARREAVGNAVELAYSVIGELNTEALRFDEEEHGVEYGRAVINELIERITPIRTALRDVSDPTGAAELISSHLGRLSDHARSVVSSPDIGRVEFSGALKALGIGAADGYIALIDSLRSLSQAG